MTDSTPAWKVRADRLGLPVATIALATGASPRSVRAYREGTRNPKPEWLERVEQVLSEIEVAVAFSGKDAA